MPKLVPPRYIRLSFFYFVYFSIFGIYLPYWALYLRDLGMSSQQVGELLAVVIATKLFAPYIGGWIADHSQSRMRIIQVAAVLGFAFFSLSLFNKSFAFLAICLFLFSFFWNLMLPQMEVITFNSLRYRAQRYSNIRLWGSVGFIVCAIGFAPLVEYAGSGVVPWLVSIALLILLFSTFSVTDVNSGRIATRIAKPRGGSILPYLRRPEILCLLGVCFMVQLSHGPYYAFFSIYMRNQGYSDFVIGNLWALGVIAEIVMFIWMPRLLSRWGAVSLLTVSLALTAGRWVLIALFPQQTAILLVAQCLHAVSFGTYHAASISLIAKWFSGSSQGRGQALYAGVSFGLGGAIGSYLTGQFWDVWGGSISFLSAAVVALVAIPLTLPMYRAVVINHR